MVGLLSLFVFASQGMGVLMICALPNPRFGLSFASLWGVLSFSICGMSFPAMAMHPMLHGVSYLFPSDDIYYPPLCQLRPRRLALVVGMAFLGSTHRICPLALAFLHEIQDDYHPNPIHALGACVASIFLLMRLVQLEVIPRGCSARRNIPSFNSTVCLCRAKPTNRTEPESYGSLTIIICINPFATPCATYLPTEGLIIFLLVVPLIYPIVYAFIYNEEVVRDVPVVVVDATIAVCRATL